MNRRTMLKSLGAGAATSALAWNRLATAADAEQVRARVNTNSEPSKLRITDLRIAPFAGSMRSWVLRLDTNQGISGYGEIRDGASATYALMLKSRIMGENPCNVDKIFRKLKQFGGTGRQAGGVVAIEIACWDLAGKAWGVPCWQMLGGKFRDKIRVYADTPSSRDPQQMGQRLKGRRDRGFSFLKMDVGINLLRETDGALAYPQPPAGDPAQSFRNSRGLPNLRHPFTGIRISDKGLEKIQEYVRTVRDIVGWDIPIAMDHLGHIGIEDAIKFCQAMDPFNLAWIEDAIPWDYTDDYVRLRNSCKTPLATGEDIYLKEGFLPLFEKRAISYCQPDLATSGGLLETKKIGDLAMEHAVSMAMHMAGSPILLFASIHCAAATENFFVLEHHDADNPYYDGLIDGVAKPLLDKSGHIQVPDGPGLGISINEEAFKEMIRKNRRGGNDPDKLFFPPTNEWNNERSADQLYSINLKSAAKNVI